MRITKQKHSHLERTILGSTLLIGIGMMAAVDEIIFHQILAWHHFYDRATPTIGLISDGFLHAAELVVIVWGVMRFIQIKQNGKIPQLLGWSGFFLGAGLFQIFDGLINHKLLKLHQVRYHIDNLFVYDLVWNGFGILLIIFSLMFYRSYQKNA